MINRSKRNSLKYVYTKKDRVILLFCAGITAMYLFLAYVIAGGSFWSFTAFHLVLAVATIGLVVLGTKYKTAAYLSLSLSLFSAGTALTLVLFYFILMVRLSGN